MCGIFSFFSNNKNLLDSVEMRQDHIVSTIQGRGPDKTSVVKDADYVAIHTLLSMTGTFREQPLIDERFLLLYNGEIYNDVEAYHAHYGDCDYLFSRLQEEGTNALPSLDGEFAICLYQFQSKTLTLATDPFGTKPLYYQLNPSSCVVGSYESTVKAGGQRRPIHQVPANTVVTISLKDFTLQSEAKIRSFDFQSQTTTTFDLWNEAFAQALRKRTLGGRHSAFVGFSSGHDSGLIAAELIESGIDFHTYTMPYLEDAAILDARFQRIQESGVSYDILVPTPDEIKFMTQYVWDQCDPFQMINYDSDFQNFPNPDMRVVPGYIASAMIHHKARKAGRLISLSGQGVDEIYADYFNPHSNPAMSELKGNWKGITGPWKNFFGGWNRVFIGSGERIAGLFGIETRYPFLDFNVVQQFLNLHPQLKGQYYKAPLTNRLRQLKFPYHERKFGFAGYKPLSSEAESKKREDSPVLVAAG